MPTGVSRGAPWAESAHSRSGLSEVELHQLVAQNRSLFIGLGGASILITGATGWFGVWLVDLLCVADAILGLGIRIVAISREPDRFLRRFPGFVGDSRITWIKADVRELETSRQSFSHVIHAAADTKAQPNSDAEAVLFATIVEGTRWAIAAAGSRCKSVLMLSSGAIYGRAIAESSCFVESDSMDPDTASVRSAYANGKRAAEQLGAFAAADGVPVRIARCFAFVGPHMPFDKHFAIGNFIADAVRGQPILVKSDGCPQRSYLYMTDLMRALLTILSEGIVGRPYNVGSDEAVSIEALARCVDRVVGGAGVKIAGAPSDPRDRYVPDITRLKAELHFVQEVALESAITRTAAWYREKIFRPVSL
ncbi:MAG: NAD(P)-dependent oxidoreductase [Gammaproteobacteria bacterium]